MFSRVDLFYTQSQIVCLFYRSERVIKETASFHPYTSFYIVSLQRFYIAFYIIFKMLTLLCLIDIGY